MFDISFMEILVISIVALIVIGPERLPAVARTVGHLYGRCRNFVYSVRTDIHNEIRMEELKKMQSSMQDTVESIENTVRQGVDHLKTGVTDAKNDADSSVNLSASQPHAELQRSIPDTDESPPDAFNEEKK
jgi:sec-independent protein translocase protein TatB